MFPSKSISGGDISRLAEIPMGASHAAECRHHHILAKGKCFFWWRRELQIKYCTNCRRGAFFCCNSAQLWIKYNFSFGDGRIDNIPFSCSVVFGFAFPLLPILTSILSLKIYTDGCSDSKYSAFPWWKNSKCLSRNAGIQWQSSGDFIKRKQCIFGKLLYLSCAKKLPTLCACCIQK